MPMLMGAASKIANLIRGLCRCLCCGCLGADTEAAAKRDSLQLQKQVSSLIEENSRLRSQLFARNQKTEHPSCLKSKSPTPAPCVPSELQDKARDAEIPSKSVSFRNRTSFNNNLLGEEAHSRFERRYTSVESFGDGCAFDDVLREFWPALRGFIEDFVLLGIVEPALKKHVWSRMRFERCSLGDEPPSILGAKAHRSDETDPERTVELAFNLDFSGEGVDVSLLIDRGLRAIVTKMSIKGTFCLELRNFLPEVPLISGICLYFMNPPEVHIDFAGVLQALEGRMIHVTKIIEKQLAAQLVVPNRLTLHFSQSMTYFELRYPPPDGILEMHLQGASNVLVPSNYWDLTKVEVYVELQLGAETWTSHTCSCDENGSIVFDEPCSFLVDARHGQSLTVELYKVVPGVIASSAVLVGSTKLSVANIANATRVRKTTWPLNMQSETFSDGDSAGEEPCIGLCGVFRPLYSSNSAEDARHPLGLADGVCGILLVVIESVRDLPPHLEGNHIEIHITVGSCKKQTWRVLARGMTQQDAGSQKVQERLHFLLTGGHGGVRSPSGAPLSPGDAAWVLGLDQDKIAAIHRGSVQARFGQSLRLKVQDMHHQNLTIEILKGSRHQSVVARSVLPLHCLLEQPQWTLPLQERPFDELLELEHHGLGTEAQMAHPKFFASMQLMCVGSPMNKVPRGRFISEDYRKFPNASTTDAVARKRSFQLSAGAIAEVSDDDGDDDDPFEHKEDGKHDEDNFGQCSPGRFGSLVCNVLPARLRPSGAWGSCDQATKAKTAVSEYCR